MVFFVAAVLELSISMICTHKPELWKTADVVEAA
jgi:hypothetical protein